MIHRFKSSYNITAPQTPQSSALHTGRLVLLAEVCTHMPTLPLYFCSVLHLFIHMNIIKEQTAQLWDDSVYWCATKSTPKAAGLALRKGGAGQERGFQQQSALHCFSCNTKLHLQRKADCNAKKIKNCMEESLFNVNSAELEIFQTNNCIPFIL